MQSRSTAPLPEKVPGTSEVAYDPKAKDVRLTFCDKLIIFFGAGAVVLMLVLIIHPNIYKGGEAYKADVPFGVNKTAEQIAHHARRHGPSKATIVGFATPEGTEAYASTHGKTRGHFSSVFGLHLSSIGIGSYLGEADEVTADLLENAVHDAIINGVNVIDTSINYLGQRSEKAIGKALRRLFLKEHSVRRDALFISTKAGFIPQDSEKGVNGRTVLKNWMSTWSESHGGKEFPKDGVVDNKHCISPECIDMSLKQSLNNLGVPTIDLLYLHNVEKQLTNHHLSRDVVMDRIAAAFRRLEYFRKAGVIRFYGLATWNSFRTSVSDDAFLSLQDLVSMAEKAATDEGLPASEHGFKFVQAPLSINLNQLADAEYASERRTFLEAAAALNISVASSRSIDAGTAGQVTRSEAVYQKCVTASRDSPSFPLSEVGHSINAVRSVVTTALVGMKQGAHVTENLRTLQALRLTEEEAKCVFSSHKDAGVGGAQAKAGAPSKTRPQARRGTRVRGRGSH